MARRVRSAILETKEARRRLERRGAPYWVRLEEGLHLGYRRQKGAGKWVMRLYLGRGVRAVYRGKETAKAYEKKVVGEADDFSDANGVAILTYDQAQAVCREMMKNRTLTQAGIVDGPYTVPGAIKDYVGYLETNGRQHRAAENRAQALILPELGDIEVAALTTDQIGRWHFKLANTPPRVRTKKGKPQRYRALDMGEEATRRRKSSANRTLTVLKAALNRAFELMRVPNNAAWLRVKPFRGVEAARLRYLSMDEARRLINGCEGEFRDLVLAGLHTGCRFGELVRLLVADFNADVGTVFVQKSKSGKARHVILTEDGVKFFARVCTGRSGDEVMLRRKWNKTEQQRKMRETLARAKITPSITFHGLRHTYASHSIMGGVPLAVVARNLGHADGRMVERHYGHLAASYIVDAIRRGAPRFGTVDDNVVPMGASYGR